MKLVTVNEYRDFYEAHLDKTRLESEGIPVILLDQHMSTLYPITNADLVGIRMQVREEDLVKAQKLLAENQVKPQQCPKCASTDLRAVHGLSPFRKWLLIALSMIVASAPPVPIGHRCRQCGHLFN